MSSKEAAKRPAMVNAQIETVEDKEQLAHRAAQEFVRVANESISSRGRFTVALSGGSTPQRIYELLADETQPYRAQIAWQHAHFFWGDERCVAPDDPQSNFRAAYDALLSRIQITEENIHRIEAERADANDAARDYERRLQTFFNLADGDFPRFDLILLGLGADGHTASLFPDSSAINEEKHLIAATWVAKLNAQRITLTVPTINHASHILFLVSGADKREIIKRIFTRRKSNESAFPAQLIGTETNAPRWIVDRSAAQLL